MTDLRGFLTVILPATAVLAGTVTAHTTGSAPAAAPATSATVQTGGWTQPKLTGPDVALGQVRLTGLGNAAMTFAPLKPGVSLLPPTPLPVGRPGAKGCWYTVEVDVRNVGGIEAQPFGATFSSSLGEAGAMVKLSGWGVAPLLPGESYTAQDTLQLSPTGETVKILLKSYPSDPHPGDNQRSLSVMVPPCTPGATTEQRQVAAPSTWTQPAGTPDLVISGLQVQGESNGTVGLGGCSFPIRFLLSNVGAAPVASVPVEFWGGTHHYVQQYANLKAGEVREIKTTGWVLGSYGTTTYTVKADPSKAVPEIQEDNNQDAVLVYAPHACAE
jgi:hypothetical protein